MAKKTVDLLENYFPTDPLNCLEYVLQRAKKVLSEETRVVTVHEIRPGPEPTNIYEFPSVEVVVRILGIPFEHPLTHKPIIPFTWFKDFFESAAMKKSFVEKLCSHVAERAPDSERLAPVKRKLRGVSTGHPSKLPARPDLLLLYEELVQQIRLAKVWIDQWRTNHSSPLANSQAEFLQAFSSTNFWWLELIKSGQLDIAQIVSGTAESTSKSILAEKFGVSIDAIHSQLFRKKRSRVRNL